MEQLYTPVKIYDKKVSYEVRKEALRAIKTGKNLQAVNAANTIADEIKRAPVYKEFSDDPQYKLI